ncbi:ribonuclease E inhibitor RraB [Shewanella indica]
MSIVEKLMDSAIADKDVLRRLDQEGDRFEVFRDVDFIIVAENPEKATIIRDFVNDHYYSEATIGDALREVRVVVHMPVTQSVILSVSGFMNCVAELFGARIDGWGCVAQRAT